MKFLNRENGVLHIPSSIHPKELNLDWLTKLNFKEASSELALLQRNTLLEKENH